jgi:putative GTP pyrophosphokinase
MEKCERKGYEKDVETIASVIHDFAGIRITTLYRDYIEQIRDMILSHPSIELIEEKDYIENPKNNGYRSLHLIVSCHTRYNGMTKSVPVEIQIRSEAQNFQAVIEHDLCYKGDVPPEVAAEMFAELADYLSIIDDKIIELRNRSKKS